AGGTGAACPRGERAVGGQLTVRDPGELLENRPAEVARRAKVDSQVEVPPLAGKVLVELAAGRVRRLRGAQDAYAEVAGELFLFTLQVGVVGDLAEAMVGDGHEQPADRRVDEVVGDVEQALACRGVAEAAIEVG